MHLGYKERMEEKGLENFNTEYEFGPYSIDEADPLAKIAVEIDGCYWHGCPICKLNSYKKLGERKQLDSNRTKELQEKGFRVIRLWEHEIKQMEVNDLRDKIICKI